MEKRKRIFFAVVAIALFAAGCYYYVVYRSVSISPELINDTQHSTRAPQIVFNQQDIEAAATKSVDPNVPATHFSKEQLDMGVQKKTDPNEPAMPLFEKQ